MSINKSLAFFVLLISLILIINLGRDIWRLIRVEERLVQAEKKLEQVKNENQDLKKTKEFYQSDAFLEEQIRNKLQMAKPGEKIVILPEAISEEKASHSAEATRDKDKETANWQKWLGLFK